LTKVETAAVLDGFLTTIAWALSNDKKVALRGFGTFKAKDRPSRQVKNPRTGETMLVEAHRAVVFKPSKELKNTLNQETQQTQE